MGKETGVADTANATGGSLDAWLDHHETLVSSLHSGASAVEDGLDGPLVDHAMIRMERLGAAVFDRVGRLLFANPGFIRFEADPAAQAEAALGALKTRQPRMSWLELGGDDGGGLSAMIHAPVELGRQWVLPPDARAAALGPDAAVVALGVAGIGAEDALGDACKAFGLTPLQTRVAIGLVRTGDVAAAARAAGVTYETARTVVADTLRRVGAPRASGLVERLVRLSYGIWPAGRDGADALSDVWGLSGRQAALALRLSEGMTRAEAAKATGISEATAKKDLGAIYDTLGVGSAAGLARVVTETRALALLTEATHHDVALGSEFLEPLGLFPRADGSHVAYSDYGPRSGKPVLVVHSSSASRPVPARLVAALQKKGFRPLALDRPGFGLTDLMADREAHRQDPFDGACEDIVGLCGHLKIRRLDLLGRGGAQIVLALARRRPDLVGAVVLVNPDPPTRGRGDQRGALAAIKEAFFRRPDLIEKLTALFVSHLSRGQYERMMMRTIADSPPDVALMSDPRARADYARGYRMFLTGRIGGYVDEQTALTRWSSAPFTDAAHWRVLLGEHDPLHDPAHTLAYWRETLPGAGIETTPGAGRFLVITHADEVAETLLGASRPAATN